MIDSTQRRMIAVAVAVCGFAVGMAGLLNYFKYRATATTIVEQRLSFTGRSIENSIQSSLALGLQFGDLATLPAMLERERATDDLIQGIDIFDTEGRPLYSTDPSRSTRATPAAWLAASRKAGERDWVVHEGSEPAVGVSIQNNFGLTIGHLAMRYSERRLAAASHAVAGELALNALAVFAVASFAASLALLAVMRGLSRDMQTVEEALDAPDTLQAHTAKTRGPFAGAMRRFSATVRAAESEISQTQAQLQRGAGA